MVLVPAKSMEHTQVFRGANELDAFFENICPKRANNFNLVFICSHRFLRVNILLFRFSKANQRGGGAGVLVGGWQAVIWFKWQLGI